MDLQSVKLAMYKYKFSSFTLSIGESKPKIHEVEHDLILRMSIVEDYDNYFFPYIEVTLSVPNDIYRTMTKNSTDISAKVNLGRKKKKDILSSDTDAIDNVKSVFNEKFYVYLNDASPDLTEDEQKKVEQSENSYGQLTTTTFLLYPYEYYKKYKKIVNVPLANVTLVEVLTYVLNKTKIKKVLLSPPNNYKTYKQFIITPISVTKQIQRICETYALHKKGTLIFYGIDRMYIIDKNPKCTAYATNEQKLTYVIYDTESEGTAQTGGCYINTKDKYTVLNASNITFNDKSEYVKKTAGNGIISVNSSGKVTKIKDSKEITSVLIQDEGNDQSSAIKQSIAESSKIIVGSFSDIDISAVTPNKQFIITINGTNYKKYNGKYRLTKVTHSFEKEGDVFQVKSSCEFKG